MSKDGVVIGFHAVEELLESGVTVGKVYVNSQADKQTFATADALHIKLLECSLQDCCFFDMYPLTDQQVLSVN